MVEHTADVYLASYYCQFSLTNVFTALHLA